MKKVSIFLLLLSLVSSGFALNPTKEFLFNDVYQQSFKSEASSFFENKGLNPMLSAKLDCDDYLGLFINVNANIYESQYGKLILNADFTNKMGYYHLDYIYKTWVQKDMIGFINMRYEIVKDTSNESNDTNFTINTELAYIWNKTIAIQYGYCHSELNVVEYDHLFKDSYHYRYNNYSYGKAEYWINNLIALGYYHQLNFNGFGIALGSPGFSLHLVSNIKEGSAYNWVLVADIGDGIFFGLK